MAAKRKIPAHRPMLQGHMPTDVSSHPGIALALMRSRMLDDMWREKMEVYDCIRTRRTVREFRPDPVPNEIVHHILRAGR